MMMLWLWYIWITYTDFSVTFNTYPAQNSHFLHPFRSGLEIQQLDCWISSPDPKRWRKWLFWICIKGNRKIGILVNKKEPKEKTKTDHKKQFQVDRRCCLLVLFPRVCHHILHLLCWTSIPEKMTSKRNSRGYAEEEVIRCETSCCLLRISYYKVEVNTAANKIFI